MGPGHVNSPQRGNGAPLNHSQPDPIDTKYGLHTIIEKKKNKKKVIRLKSSLLTLQYTTENSTSTQGTCMYSSI